MLFKSTTSRNIFSVAACGLIATMAASAVLFNRAYGDIKTASIDQMRQIARAEAISAEKMIGGMVKLVDALDTALTTMKRTGDADRNRADALLSSMLHDNPDVLGFWTGWEKDAFDGRDADYAGKEGHDATGRYVPYWARSGDAVAHTALVDYALAGPGDYYQQPFNQGRTVVIEPYPYDIGGQQVLITSISKPIVIDGKTVGVAGLDISLGETSKAMAAIRPMGSGFISLVSGANKIVSHPDVALVGKSLAEGGAQTAGWDGLIAEPGVAQEIVAPDGTVHMGVASDVKMVDGMTWHAVVWVPKSTVMAQLNAMIRESVLIIGIAAVLLALSGWFIARRFVARITNVIEETGKIASGDLTVTPKDAGAKDELGDLARSLEVLLENNRQKMRLEAAAAAERERQESERVDRARIAEAQEADVKFAVSELAAGLVRLSDGDMTVSLGTPFISSLDEIRNNFNHSVEKLRAAMLSFSENAAIIQTGADEIRAAADDLARRTEQQAASVEQTAAALEEITTSVKDSTLRAEEAGALVGKTKENAERSGDVVQQAVDAMHGIEQSSQSISNIIGVIDEIAFQTNLLALNAGVEAARAGDAGKGFAVVAQEVRELAQRSANAAKEIKTLIHSSGAQVNHGVDLVSRTGEALASIVREVQQINGNVQAIVQSAREQSTGLQEINTAVNQMDQTTQKNAAMVEESNAASHTLATEVAALSGRLAQFTLGESTARNTGINIAVDVTRQNRATASPVQALKGKLASAFAGRAVAPASNDWQEF